jgi:transposase
VSGLDLTLDPKPAPVRRIEVITGGGARRRWSDEEKAQAIEATLAPGAVVSQVARRHGLTPQQLFTWRREARQKAQADQETRFVPAVLDEVAKAPPTAEPAAPASGPVIEVDVNGAHVRIWPTAEPGLTTAVLRALRPVGAR